MRKVKVLTKAQLAKSKRLWKEHGRCPALYMLHLIKSDEGSTANTKQPGRILPEEEGKHSEKVVFNITFKHSLRHPSQTVFTRWCYLKIRNEEAYLLLLGSVSLYWTLPCSSNCWFYSGNFWIMRFNSAPQFLCPWLSSWILFLL